MLLNAVNASPGNRNFLSSNVATKNGKCLESVSKHAVDVSKCSKNAVGVSDMARKQSRCFKQGRQGNTAGASKVFKNRITCLTHGQETHQVLERCLKPHQVVQTWPGNTAGASKVFETTNIRCFRHGQETQQVFQRYLKTTSRVSHMARRHSRFFKGM